MASRHLQMGSTLRPAARRLTNGAPCRRAVHALPAARQPCASLASRTRRTLHPMTPRCTPPNTDPSTTTTSAALPPAATTTAAAGAAAAVAPWKWEESPDALVAYGVLAGVLLLGAVPNDALRSGNGVELLYFISLAVCTQYIGAHRALTTTARQQLSFKQGLLAPVIASASLFTCYLIITYLPQISLATLLNWYFWLLGCFATYGALSPTLKQVGGDMATKSIRLDVPDGWLVDSDGTSVKTAELAPTDLLAAAGALGLSTAYLLTSGGGGGGEGAGEAVAATGAVAAAAAAAAATSLPNFTLNNLMACLIATDILQLIGLRSFRVAALLLLGLAAYDVFWVFASPKVIGDNVMLTVATSDMITGPSRLLFPRAPGGVGEAADFPFSLLGLGDIAIPGLLACLALRYDASRTVDMSGRAQAAAAAMEQALKDLGPSATATEMGAAASKAADSAYDRFADAEEARGLGTQPQPASQGAAAEGAPAEGQAAASGRVQASDSILAGGQRTYLGAVVVANVVGLLTAFAANSITHMGQPALLYIVPASLGAVALTGAARGDLQRLWHFTDAPSFGVDPPGGKKDKETAKQE